MVCMCNHSTGTGNLAPCEGEWVDAAVRGGSAEATGEYVLRTTRPHALGEELCISCECIIQLASLLLTLNLLSVQFLPVFLRWRPTESRLPRELWLCDDGQSTRFSGSQPGRGGSSSRPRPNFITDSSPRRRFDDARALRLLCECWIQPPLRVSRCDSCKALPP
jgi:hypothetical protein